MLALAGTNLGDPIEMAAANAVLMSGAPQGESPGQPLTLAAGKSSIGHTEPAAGLAAMYHALHAMQSSFVQPILHFRQVCLQFNNGVTMKQSNCYCSFQVHHCWLVYYR